MLLLTWNSLRILSTVSCMASWILILKLCTSMSQKWFPCHKKKPETPGIFFFNTDKRCKLSKDSDCCSYEFVSLNKI